MWNQMKRVLVSLGVTGVMLFSASIAVPTVDAAQTLSTPTASQGFSGTSVTTAPLAVTTTTSANKGVTSTETTSPTQSGAASHSAQTGQDFIRGGYRSGSRGFSGRSYSSPSRSTFGSTSGYGGSTFGRTSPFGSHLFSFGAGYMLGSLFHPFGGYYGWGGGYGFHSFSLFGFIIDLIVLWIIWRIVRSLFFRR